jgi:hypothetical protein
MSLTKNLNLAHAWSSVKNLIYSGQELFSFNLRIKGSNLAPAGAGWKRLFSCHQVPLLYDGPPPERPGVNVIKLFSFAADDEA